MTYEFSVSPADFDLSLLPPNARQVGSPEFGEAVHNYLKRQFEGFGGTARIVVSDELIQVTWNPDSDESDPLQAAIELLKRGRYPEAIQLMELLRRRNPADVGTLYNLGMALSETGQLERAVEILRRLVSLDPGYANGRVAMGAALSRHGKTEEAIKELRAAVTLDPNNPYAWRNLGGCLLKTGEMAEGEESLRRAVQLSPTDQQAWYGLAEASFVQDQHEDADELYRKAMALDPTSNIAELARGRLGEIAQAIFRGKTPGVERFDAVMYLLGAMQRFERMSRQEVQKIGSEIATVGMRGFDVNDSTQKYQLRSLPGRFSGLHMVSLMYAAFKIINPTADIGFDLSREYAEAMQMKDQWKG